jgi:hypothetical protein
MVVAVAVATFFALMGPLFEAALYAAAGSGPIEIPKICCYRWICWLC